MFDQVIFSAAKQLQIRFFNILAKKMQILPEKPGFWCRNLICEQNCGHIRILRP